MFWIDFIYLLQVTTAEAYDDKTRISRKSRLDLVGYIYDLKIS